MARFDKYELQENIKYVLIFIGIIVGLAVVFVVGMSIYDRTDRGMLGRAATYCQKNYEKTYDDYCPTKVDGVPITCVELTTSSSTACSFDNPSGRDPKSLVETHYW